MTGWGVVLFSGYLLNRFLAVQFDLKTFGDYGLIMTVLLWIEIFVITGIPTALPKYVSSHSNQAYRILWASVRLQGCIIFGIGILAFSVFPLILIHLFHAPELEGPFRLAFLDIPVYGFFYVFLSFYNGLRQFQKQALCHAFYGLSKLGFIVGLVFFHRNLVSALGGNILGSLAGLVLTFVLLEQKSIKKPLYEKELFRFAFPAIWYFLLVQLVLSMDLWFVNALCGRESGSYYYAASTLARIPYFLLAGLSAVLLPTLSHSISSENIERVRRIISQAFRWGVITLLPVLIIFFFYRRELLTLFFSARFLPAEPFFVILTLAMVCMAFLSLFFTVINADGRPRKSLLIAAGMVIFDVLLNGILISYMDAVGAGLATLLTCVGGLIWTIADITRRFKMRLPSPTYWKIGTAILVLYMVLWIFPSRGIGFIGASILGSMGYGLVLVLTKEIILEIKGKGGIQIR